MVRVAPQTGHFKSPDSQCLQEDGFSALRGSSASVHTFDPVVETFPVKSGFVRTFERYPVPDHSAGIKGIPKNPLNRSAFHEIAAFGVISQFVTASGDCSGIVIFQIVLIHDELHMLYSASLITNWLSAAGCIVPRQGDV